MAKNIDEAEVDALFDVLKKNGELQEIVDETVRICQSLPADLGSTGERGFASFMEVMTSDTAEVIRSD